MSFSTRRACLFRCVYSGVFEHWGRYEGWATGRTLCHDNTFEGVEGRSPKCEGDAECVGVRGSTPPRGAVLFGQPHQLKPTRSASRTAPLVCRTERDAASGQHAASGFFSVTFLLSGFLWCILTGFFHSVVARPAVWRVWGDFIKVHVWVGVRISSGEVRRCLTEWRAGRPGTTGGWSWRGGSPHARRRS